MGDTDRPAFTLRLGDVDTTNAAGLTASRRRQLIARCWCRRGRERCAQCARWLREMAAEIDAVHLADRLLLTDSS